MSDGAAMMGDAGDTGGAEAHDGAIGTNGGGDDTGRVAGQGDNSGGGFDANGDWRSFFGEGLDEDTASAWQTVSTKYRSPNEFAKGVVELNKGYGSRVAIPGENATPEDWGKFYDRTGRPKDPSEYQFADEKSLPEGLTLSDTDKEFLEAFKPVAHRAGLTQKQVSDLEGWQYQQAKVQADAFLAKADHQTETNIKTMQATYGPDFEKVKNVHATTLKHYAGNSFDTVRTAQMADGTFLADQPWFVDMMSKIGMERQEDFREASPFNADSVASAQDEIDKIESEAMAKGLNPTHADWPHAQLDKLYSRAIPSKPMSHMQAKGR